MKALRDGTTVGLDRSRILRLEHARGVRVACRSGMLWLTQEGDPQDAFLAPGEQIRIGTRRLVLVEALQDSTLCLSEPEPGISSYYFEIQAWRSYAHEGPDEERVEWNRS